MSKKIKLPAILMAHNLLAGNVLYWSGADWHLNLSDAKIIVGENELDEIQNVIKTETAKNIVFDIEIVEVFEGEDGRIVPRHFRELIKTSGPTVSYGVKI